MSLIQIDLTLFAQAISFLISYVMLERLLIRPSVEQIREEGVDLLKAQKELEQEKMLFDQIKKTREDRWQLCKEYFKDKSPHDSSKVVEVKGGISIESFHADKKELKELAQEVGNKLLKRIDGVD